MKSLTKKEIKEAKRLAHLYNLYTVDRFRRRYAKSLLDMRTRIGIYANSIKCLPEFQKNNIQEKRKERLKLKSIEEFKNIFDYPLVKDYIKNKPTRIEENRLVFGNRNHWAKNRKDLKILNILKKHN